MFIKDGPLMLIGWTLIEGEDIFCISILAVNFM